MNGSVVAEYEATGGTGYGVLKRMNVKAGGRLLAVDEVQTDGSKVTSYLMADRQGSTRVLMNAAGAVTSRHDYLPFGEELGAGTGAPGSPTGMRTAAQGYSAADNVRDRYAGTRLDDATGLDHTLWRKLETRSGRWTTPDPYGRSMRQTDPQSFNRYAYVHNDPVNLADPGGLDLIVICFARISWSESFWRGSCVSFDTAEAGPQRMPGEPDLNDKGIPIIEPQNPIEKLKGAINFCLGMFEMSLTSFKPSEKGKDGSATVNFTNGRTINGLSGFGVVNDVTTYTKEQIDAIYKQRTGVDTRLLGFAASGTVNGLNFDPHTNYTANNLSPTDRTGTSLETLVGTQLAIQVHELGNSISMITGIKFSSFPRDRDEDEGRAFENCVGKNY